MSFYLCKGELYLNTKGVKPVDVVFQAPCGAKFDGESVWENKEFSKQMEKKFTEWKFNWISEMVTWEWVDPPLIIEAPEDRVMAINGAARLPGFEGIK